MNPDRPTAEELVTDESFQQFVLESDQQSIAKWEQWISENRDFQDQVEIARSIILSLSPKKQDLYQKKSFDLQQLQLRLIKEESGYSPATQPNRTSRNLWRSAAMISLLAALAFALWWYQSNSMERFPSNESIVEHNSSRGLKRTIQLLDGTIVKLNSESAIRYEENKSKGIREVFLSGEAYFEVTSDPLRPFVVNAGQIKTKVLGTAFNLKAYPTDSRVEVALVHGKVEVRDSNGLKKTLNPTEMLSYNSETQTVEISAFEVDRITGWKDGILYFEEADFKEIKESLERWYNVEIIVKGRLEGKAFTGKFYNESLDHVLNGIGFSLHFHHEMNGRKVTIYPNP